MNNRTKGISLAIITAVMWGIMGMFVRGLTGYAFTTFEISFFRCAHWQVAPISCFCCLQNPRL